MELARRLNEIAAANWSYAVVMVPVFYLPLALAAGGDEATSEGQRVSCARRAPKDFASGGVTVIKNGKPPCRIVFRKTGVRLEAVADGSRPDPGRTVLRDSGGRFYSANAPGFRSVITVWDRKGGYVSSFGREGEAPGELSANGMLSLLMDDGDNLHVRDGAYAWSVFSPDHEFLRRVPAKAMVGLRGTTVILDNPNGPDEQRRIWIRPDEVLSLGGFGRCLAPDLRTGEGGAVPLPPLPREAHRLLGWRHLLGRSGRRRFGRLRSGGVGNRRRAAADVSPPCVLVRVAGGPANIGARAPAAHRRDGPSLRHGGSSDRGVRGSHTEGSPPNS